MIVEEASSGGSSPRTLWLGGSPVVNHTRRGGSLTGLRVAVTRSDAGGPQDRLARLVSETGAQPIPVPLTATEPPADPAALAQAVENLSTYDWLVVTSARTVPPLVEALQRAETSVEHARRRGLRLCSVGPHTGEALTAAELSPDLVPERFWAEGVVESLLGRESPEDLRILFPRAEGGRDLIPTLLREAGANVDVVTAYRTVPIPHEGTRLSELVEAGAVDVLTFTAGSAARVFIDSWEAHQARRGVLPEAIGSALPEGTGILALGPATASVLQGQGLTVHGVATPHTLDGLVAALRDWFALRDRSDN